MVMNYTRFPDYFGGILQVGRKREALWQHATRANDVDFDRRLYSRANGLDNTVTAENRTKSRLNSQLDDVQGPGLEGLFTSWFTEAESLLGLFGIIALDSPLVTDADRAASPIAVSYTYSNTDGVIAITERLGILGALRRDMLANSQKVVANVVAFTGGDIVADSVNIGKLTSTTMTGLSHTLAGELLLRCTGENVDAPEFSVELELTDRLAGQESPIITADNPVTAERAYEDGPTGLTLLLTRPGLAAPVEAGDTGNIFSSTTFLTPAETDMNTGVLQIRVTRNASAPDFTVEFFNSSGRTTKVGQTTVTGLTGTVALDVTLNGKTRFQSTFDKAAAAIELPVSGNVDNDISFDIETPRVGDVWTRPVTNDEAGNFATRIAHVPTWRISLPTTGSNLFTDSLAVDISVP